MWTKIELAPGRQSMPRVPTSVQDLLDFCRQHSDSWQTSATAIGLTAAQVTAFKTVVGDAESAVTNQGAARATAKSSTLTANQKVKALRTSVAGMIRSITTFASVQANPDAVYASAQIDPPQPRTPSEPPGQPTNITATLDDQGAITLKWKCANPPGGNVVYSITRRVGSTGAFNQVGASGSRVFLDEAIPAGSAVVQYIVRGYRGQTVGPASATFVLQFGSAGGGGFAITGSFTEQSKAA
jgi:hypothetical protein